jgi:vancomycin aglycone glucosyltransferase
VRFLLATYGSRGDVEPIAGLAVRLRQLGAEVLMCAPPDHDLSELDVRQVPLGAPMRTMTRPSSAGESSRRVAEFIAAQYATLVAAADGCDALVATGFTHFAARSVADRLDIRYVPVTFCPVNLPSPHHPPLTVAGPPPPGVTGNEALWEWESRTRDALWGPAINAHREQVGLPPIDDVMAHMFGDHPWLAADPVLAPGPGEQTGAWIRPDHRPLPAGIRDFLDAGPPPVYVGFGSMRPDEDAARTAIEAIRAQGRRVLVSRGWAGLAPIDDRDDCLIVGDVNHQALFPRVAAVMHHGGAGTTTTAAQAGVPQVVLPQRGDQPYWAGRVAALGIGGDLATALNPQTRARAQAVAATIRTDGTTVAANLLIRSEITA